MKRISIDNGATYTEPEQALQVMGIDEMAEYMESDTRENVHNEAAPCTAVEFLTKYLENAKEDLIIG